MLRARSVCRAGSHRKYNGPSPTIRFIGHVELDKIENDEIVAQFATAVFAAFHIRFEIIP